MANKPSKVKKSDYTAVIEASNGTMTDISKRLNITHSAVMQYFDAHQDIKELYEKKRMTNVDLAEEVLFEHLKKGTDQKVRQDSAKFITTRLGKKRGWTEKTELEHSGEMNQTIDLSLITMCKEYNESNSGNPDSSKPRNKK